MPAPDAAEYLSAQAIADMTSVHVATVWEWAKQPGFPAPYRLSAKATRWKRREFEDWLETKRAPR
ncbi:helix-turn-helix transcriptional regulator [Ancylobacter amanitiformis]|uniref:helix-turn-helix transcriptional regulator n=1 Tax=Ancylobacter amanitiformis TaxID=217069 RepID=UPI0035215A54